MQGVIERDNSPLSSDTIESLSDLLASMLVAEWRSRHAQRCNPPEAVTVSVLKHVTSMTYENECRSTVTRT